MIFNVRQLSILVIIIGLISSSLISQNYKGKVISAENGLEIVDVQILDSLEIQIAKTTVNGSFSLGAPGTYSFNKEGYFSKTISLDGNKFLVIEMSERPLQLNEVLIKINNFYYKSLSKIKEFSPLYTHHTQSNKI